jgi:hypothetical protein
MIGVEMLRDALARITGDRVADICTHVGSRFSEHPHPGGA